MAIITNINTVITNGPTVLTTAKANAAAGKIMDYAGNCKLIQTKLNECKNLITDIIADTDAGDPSLTTLNTILTDLA